MAEVQMLPPSKEADTTKKVTEKATEKAESKKEEKSSLTAETINSLEKQMNQEMAEIDKIIEEKQSQTEAFSKDHEEELKALKLRDEMLAKKEAEMAKGELETEQGKIEIESIEICMKDIATKKYYKSREKAALEKRREKQLAKKEKCALKAEEYDAQIKELSGEEAWWTNFKRERYLKKRQGLSEEEADLTKEIKELEDKIASAQQELDELDKRNEEWTEQIEQRKTAIKEKEEKNNRLKMSYEGEKAAADATTPEWYMKYKQAEADLKGAQEKKKETKNKLDHNEERVKGMRRVTLTTEDGKGTEKEVLVDEAGEIYGDTTGVEESAKKVSEEQKVESKINTVPIFQAVNKNTIPDYLKYNPDTGSNYEEGEEVKGDSTFERSLRQLGDMTKEFEPAIKDLMANPKLVKLEEFLFSPYKPLTAILNFLISKDGMEKCLKELNEIRAKIQSNEFRKSDPFKYNLASMVISSLGSTLDTSDKGEFSDKTFLASFAGAKMVPLAGNKAGGFIAALAGMVETKDIAAFIAEKMAEQLISSASDETIGNIKDTVKNSATGVSEAIDAHGLKKEVSTWEKMDNPQFTRMVAAARRAKINNSVDAFVDTGASVGKTIFANEKMAGTIISGISMGAKLLIGKGFEAYDKSALLNSPQVFGSVRYNKKLVPDEKFNEILKKCTGITSKDKVYSAVKTTDAIAIHQRMRKSIKTPDFEVERLLSSFGYKDKKMYPNIRIADLMKKTGHEPAGGDWRQELKDTLLVEGKDYRTLMQSVGDGLKGGVTKKGKMKKRRRALTAGYSW